MFYGGTGAMGEHWSMEDNLGKKKEELELDMPGEPLSHTMNSETEVRSYYDNMKEEVFGCENGNSGSFLLPVRKKRYEYGQVGES